MQKELEELVASINARFGQVALGATAEPLKVEINNSQNGPNLTEFLLALCTWNNTFPDEVGWLYEVEPDNKWKPFLKPAKENIGLSQLEMFPKQISLLAGFFRH